MIVSTLTSYHNLWPFRKLRQFYFQLVHVILIVLMAVMDATIRFAMLVEILLNSEFTLFRMIGMLITKMPVWVRQVKLLVNVSWIAMMTVAVKLLVYQPSKMSTAIVLARFIMELTKMYFNTFSQEKCPLGCPCDNYDCDLPEKKAILTLYSNSKPPVLIQPNGKFLTLISWIISF